MEMGGACASRASADALVHRNVWREGAPDRIRGGCAPHYKTNSSRKNLADHVFDGRFLNVYIGDRQIVEQ
jgi:hypothetical protein